MRKITLFLMSEKGYNALKSIIAEFGSNVLDLIVVGRDKQVSNDYSKEILKISNEYGIKTVDRSETYTVNTPYAIAISWRWMIATSDTFQLITLHDSLLPKYRGFSPLVNQLINQEKYIGVSAILSTEEYDKGDIIFQTKTAIEYPIKIKDAIAKVSKLYAEVILRVVTLLGKKESLVLVSQNEAEASYSLWRNENDYSIDWNQKSSTIRRFIDAVGEPYKGASTKMLGKKIRIYEVNEEQDVQIINRDCGKVIFMRDGYPVIVCGEGLLKITNAIYEDSGASIFPFKKFRIQFT